MVSGQLHNMAKNGAAAVAQQVEVAVGSNVHWGCNDHQQWQSKAGEKETVCSNETARIRPYTLELNSRQCQKARNILSLHLPLPLRSQAEVPSTVLQQQCSV